MPVCANLVQHGSIEPHLKIKRQYMGTMYDEFAEEFMQGEPDDTDTETSEDEDEEEEEADEEEI